MPHALLIGIGGDAMEREKERKREGKGRNTQRRLRKKEGGKMENM
jgi:hypothetical protein